MKKKYRWKMRPRETGLAAIGAEPRGHELHDGEGNWIASVCPNGGVWSSMQKGWFYCVNSGSGAPHYNSVTDKVFFDDVKDAKNAAVKYIKDNGGVL